MKPPLHDYQEVAVAFLQGRDRCGLFLDMGLGKTRCCIEALEDRHLPALVIAPPRVAEHTWHAEVAKWRPELSVARAVGNAPKRAEALSSEADVTTLSFNSIADAVGHRKYRTVIIDEISRLKGRGSWYKDAKRITQGVPHVWGLTGTPNTNGLEDLYGPVFVLDRGARLGATITAFRSRWFTPGRRNALGVTYEWIEKPEAEAEVHAALEDICLSMKSEGRIKLPPVTRNFIDVPLPNHCKSAYRQMQVDLVTDLRDLFGEEAEVHTSANAAVATSKLAQMCAGFSYVDDQAYRGGKYQEMHSARLDALSDLRENIDSPLLVAYDFIPERDRIFEKFPDAEDIDAPDVVGRWTRGDIPMLVVHAASVGHGLNLQQGPGHHLVWNTIPWDLELYQQMIGRLVRQGQKNPVVVHHFYSPGTVDSVKRSRLESKEIAQDRLMTHLESPI